MPGDFTYMRKFIIFRNDYTNIGNINPKGYGKIEIKGNKGTMRINLENCEIDQEYRIYLLKEDKGIVEELDLGRILTDERGRGRADININLRELYSKGFPVEKLAAIVIRRDNYVLLGAYVDKVTGIIERYIGSISAVKSMEPAKENIQLEAKPEQEEVQEEVYEEAKPAEEPEVHMEEADQAIEQVKEHIEYEEAQHENLTDSSVDEGYEYTESIEVAETKEPQETETDEIEDMPIQMFEESSIKEDLVEEKPMEEKEQDQPEEVAEPVFQEFQEVQFEQPSVGPWTQHFPQGQFSQQYQNYQSLDYIRRLNNKNQMTNYILSVLKYFPQVQPLKVYLHGYTWWRIDDDGSNSYRGFLPYYNYLFSSDYKYPFLYNSATCINQIMKYGHYLFGLYREGNEIKYYVYAIPGRFVIEEHPFKGITGFNTWYESIDGIGYWILYIDPMTGKVIYPINPMVPTE